MFIWRTTTQQVPLAISLFIVVIFFTAHHNFFAPRFYKEMPSSPAETIAESTAEGNPARQVALLTLAIFSIWRLFQKGKYDLRMNGIIGWSIIFYLLWAILSITWSDNTLLTGRRVFILLVLWLAALSLAKHHSFYEIVFISFFCTFILLMVGITAEISLGTFLPLSSDYRFAGTIHPNHQGWNCATLLIASSVLTSTNPRSKKRFIIIGLLALIFLLLTKSRTAFASVLLVLIFYRYLAIPAPKRLLYTLGAAWLICFFFLLLLNTGNEFMGSIKSAILLGRTDPYDAESLTGRIPLWIELLQYAKRSPFIGYGFNAFFTPNHVLDISKVLGWGVPGAHSGYMELLLGVGIVGLVAYVVILLFGITKYLKLYLSSNNLYILFAMMMIGYYTLVMSIEEILTDHAIPSLIVYTLLSKIAFTNLMVTDSEQTKEL
jgi:exopolysaccharide production protein ExoQ